MATARPVIPPHRPIATPRFSVGNASLISVSVNGVTMRRAGALEGPCGDQCPDARGQCGRAEAAVNTPTPIVNIRRRPNRSPSAAPVSSRHANDRL